MTGLGVINTDLCVWAGTLTPEMMDAAYATPGHPVLKAKPAPVSETQPVSDWLSGFNCWVGKNPVLAALVIAGGYVVLRRAS